ncbi:EI24 domain-containing protein [Roseovarius pacificus]|uniref:EI24 domain-containing protein n=1 Tax=Roseovarius pacificus TaxID=337701 RepID=UPI0029690D0D|nr:EI24 domain-containing protein [Roseovarius pacificus]MDW3118800.1 EI24 domain-containing protein [Roseovarius pacificus]
MGIGMIFTSFFKALSQIGDPRFRKVLWRGIGLTLLLLAGITALLVWGVGWMVGDTVTLPLLGEVQWVDNVISWAFVALMFVMSVFLMVPVASAFVSMFLDEVAEAVEDRHYPGLPKVAGVPLRDGIIDGLSAMGVLIVANILALLLTLVLPIAGLPVFYAVNGFLLGREYFTVAAMRRLGRAGATQMRKKHGLTIWMAGVLMAVPLTVPILNLVVPILGAATFTHLFHRLQARAAR